MSDSVLCTLTRISRRRGKVQLVFFQFEGNMEKKVGQRTDENDRYQRFIEPIRKLEADARNLQFIQSIRKSDAEERERRFDKVFEVIAAEKKGAYRRTR